MGWRGKGCPWLTVLGKQPSLMHERAAITVLRWGLFVHLCILRETFIYRVPLLFEILYLKWKEDNSLARLKIPSTIKQHILWGEADMRVFTS